MLWVYNEHNLEFINFIDFLTNYNNGKIIINLQLEMATTMDEMMILEVGGMQVFFQYN